jgi:hypothetical protein
MRCRLRRRRRLEVRPAQGDPDFVGKPPKAARQPASRSVRRRAAAGQSRWRTPADANDACRRLVEGTYRGGPMDFSAKLDELQQRAAEAKASAQAETRP